ncbi:MAG TPA: O-antigen ligase family protein, partial [Pirellulales bacterium]
MSRRNKQDERRGQAKNRAPTAAKISPATASPNLSAADDRPDALRPWLMFGATALIVARPFVTSDGGPWMGDGEPFAALWIILVILWTLGALGRSRFKLRFTWADWAVAAYFAWWLLAAVHCAEHGALRPSFNMLWDGVATFIGFFTLRQLAPVGREARALVAVMIGVAVVLSSISFHQYFTTLPADRARVSANPQEALREAGMGEVAPGSPEYELYRARLETTEALATFSLTNSLAAFLAPWLIMTLGIAATVGRDERRRIRLWLATGLCGLVIAGALALTRSRSAWIAAGVGAIMIWLPVWRSRSNALSVPANDRPAAPRVAPKLRRRWPIIAGIAAVGIMAVVAIAIWRPSILEPALRSFRFRLEYWQSTLAMIKDHPWLGCGPGNFGDYYLQYKLPTAAEEIKDPHNFAFEIAANAGLPALAAFGVVIGVLWRRVRHAALFTDSPDAINSGEAASATRWIFAGAALAVLLAIALNLVLWFEPRQLELIVGLTIGAAVLALLLLWIRDGRLPPRLMAAGVVVLLVALLAVGGISFAGVAGTLWLLTALVFNATDPPEAVRSLPWSASLGLFVVGVVLAFVQHQTGYQPVMKYKSALGAAAEAADIKSSTAEQSRRAIDVFERRLREAGEADPWSVEPWQRLALQRLQDWISAPVAARRRQTLDEFDR